MNEELLQRCEVCNEKMETKRVTQRTCSLKCAGSLGGKVKNPNKGFGSLGTASEAGRKGGKAKKRK